MEARHVKLGIISRMLAWGGASGAVLGALYPYLALILIYVLTALSSGDSANLLMLSIWLTFGWMVGLVIGGIAGLVIGLITGVVLAIVTSRLFSPIADNRRYWRALEIICVVVGGSASLLLVLVSNLPQHGADIPNGWGAEWSWAVWGVNPALIATVATWRAGRNVAGWVESKLT